MGTHDSESVGDLLKQAYSVHNSMKNGLQTQVSELKKKVADLENIIAKCSSCPKCGNQLVKSQTKISQHSNENAKKVKNDNSTAEDDNKRLKINNEIANDKTRIVVKSIPKPVVIRVERVPKPVVREKPIVVTCLNETPSLFNVKNNNSTAEDDNKRRINYKLVNNKYQIVLKNNPKPVVREKPILETDLNETPSLFNDSWVNLSDTPFRKSVSQLDKPTSPLDKQIKNTFGDKKEQNLTKRNNNKPVQVTLDKAFCFSVEKKGKDLNETIKDSDVSPSILHSDPVTTVAPEYDFSQDLLEDYTEFEQLTNKCTEKTEKTKSGFKYKAEVTRNREDRAKLDGFSCLECKNYYGGLNLTEEEMKERMKMCSKHRDNHVPSSTPEHFWDIDFPTTQEAKERGYIKSTQYCPLQPRRKRKLTESTVCRLFDS